jgi:hypothetical protein
MRRIMSFEIFESASQLTEEQVEFLDEHTKGSWKLNAEGKIDVKGDFNCYGSELQDFKGLRFGTVSGDFSCSSNSLTSLEGAPETVVGDFYCHGNSLISLEGAPKTVEGDFDCSRNSLTSLKGAPETVGGDFYSDNLVIAEGKWNLEGWLEALETGYPKQKQLILTLLSPEALNKRLKEDPEKTMVELKGIWNSSSFTGTRSQLVLPKGLEGEMDLLGDLDGIGL